MIRLKWEYSPSAKGPRKMSSWSYLDILLESCWSVAFPCPNPCRPQENASVGILGDNRSSPLLCGPRPARHLRARRPLCNVPWPSCYRRPTGRRRSCRGGRFVRTDRSGPSPWCRVPDRWALPWERICRLEMKFWTVTIGSSGFLRWSDLLTVFDRFRPHVKHSIQRHSIFVIS